MKRLNALVLLALALAQNAYALDIHTRGGRILHDCTISAVTQTGVRVIYRDGVKSVDFRDLPSDVQKQLHYDAEKGRSDYATAAKEAFEWCWAIQRQKEETIGRQQAEQKAREAAEIEATKVAKERVEVAARRAEKFTREDGASQTQQQTAQQSLANTPSPPSYQSRTQQRSSLSLEEIQKLLALTAKAERFNQLSLFEQLEVAQEVQQLSQRRQNSYESSDEKVYGTKLKWDEFGRPASYRTEDGRPVSPLLQDNVQRNYYGEGAHADEFGRPVHDAYR